MRKLWKRLKGKKVLTALAVMTLLLTSTLVVTKVNADDEPFYSGSLNEDIDRGSVIATFEFGTYPNKLVEGIPEGTTLDPDTEELWTLYPDKFKVDYDLLTYLNTEADEGRFPDGTILEYGGKSYLREDDYVWDTTIQGNVPINTFYEMAPIKWQVLKIGKHSDGTNKVVAITRDLIDSRIFNGTYTGKFLWDGSYFEDYYTGDDLLDNNKERHTYPFIRLFLNSYDIYDEDGNQLNYTDLDYVDNSEWKRTYSTLTPETHTGEYRNKGFYEKAFSDDEKEAILLDTNEVNVAAVDGDVCYDKVRLLSAFETFDTYDSDYLYDYDFEPGIGSKFGFAPLQSAYGTATGRTCSGTGYVGWIYSSALPSFETEWWTKSCGDDPFFVGGFGSVVEGLFQNWTYVGVRPVISIKADYFETNNIKLDIMASAYPHSELAGWKVNGLFDESLTENVIENVDLFDLHKYKANFKSETGFTNINETTYTLYHQNDDEGLNHGYINYGSFPQSEITSTSDYNLFTELETRLTSDGMTSTYGGNKYLREDKEGTPHYFLFEPIKWQILNFDKDERKLILLSESCIDSGTWNSFSGRNDPSTIYDDESVYWNGQVVDDDPPFHIEDDKVAYPSLRLYLNSYDTTLSSYTFDGTKKYSLSKLQVTNYSDRPFANQGFLTKAFTSDEINHLIEESNENYIGWSDYEYYDSLYGEPFTISKDKVRLLSCCEMNDWGSDPESGRILDIYARYGFNSVESVTGPESNRLGYTTPYSEFRFKPSEKALDYDLDYVLPQEYEGRNTIPWWTMSLYEDGRYYGSYLNGSDGSADCLGDTADYAGIRPLISLDVSNLTAISGDGTLNNPYTLGDTCLLRLSSENTSKGTVSSSGTSQNGSFLEGRFTIHNLVTVVASPKEGYKFDGWYKGQSKVSDNASYSFNLDGNTTLLAKFIEDPQGGGGTGGGGTSGGGGGGAASPKKETPKEEKKVMTFKAFMNGYEDKSFKPKEFVTREEVAVIASRTNSDFDELTSYIDDNKFTDTFERWSKNYLGFTYQRKFLKGYEDGSFHPSSNMTRGELATLALNILETQEDKDDKENKKQEELHFSDIEGKWYEENVKKLSCEGILNGYEDGTFKGDNFVTRTEVAIVFNKLTGRSKDLINDDDIKKVENLFTDVKKTDWFFDELVLATLDHEKEEVKETK